MEHHMEHGEPGDHDFVASRRLPPPRLVLGEAPDADEDRWAPTRLRGRRQRSAAGLSQRPIWRSCPRGEPEDRLAVLRLLHQAGLTAIPRVQRGADGQVWVESGAPVLEPQAESRASRRAQGAGGDPGALRARTALESALRALHGAGWCLGLDGARGIARRVDGGVLIDDVSQMRRLENSADRQADLAWLDLVLPDPDATCVRPVPPMPSEGPVHHSDAERAEFAPLARLGSGGRTIRKGQGTRGPGPNVPTPESAAPPVSAVDATPGQTASAVEAVKPLPWTDVIEAVPERRRRPPWSEILIGALVIVATAFIALSILIPRSDPESAAAQPSTVPAEVSPSTASTSTPAAGGRSPAQTATAASPRAVHLALAEQLIAERRAYLAGASDYSPSSDGSLAAEQDAQLRAELRGADLLVWEVELLDARMTEAGAGQALLHVDAVESDIEIRTPEGELRSAPGAGSVHWVMKLRWEDGRWVIEEVESQAL